MATIKWVDLSTLTAVKEQSELVGKTVARFASGTYSYGDHDWQLWIFTDDTYLLERSSAGYEESSINWDNKTTILEIK